MAFKDFFNSQTSASMVRLLSFLSIVTAMALTAVAIFYIMYKLLTTQPIEIEVLTFFSTPIITLFAFGLGAKVGQKYAEGKEVNVNEFTKKDND